MINTTSTNSATTKVDHGLVAETPQPRKKTKFNLELANTVMNQVLHIATVACAVISITPLLRSAGSLALKAVESLSKLLIISEKLNNDIMGTVIKCLNLAIITFGLVTIAAALSSVFICVMAFKTAAKVADGMCEITFKT